MKSIETWDLVQSGDDPPDPNPIFIQNCPHYELLHLNFYTFVYINRLITLLAAGAAKNLPKLLAGKSYNMMAVIFLILEL